MIDNILCKDVYRLEIF